MGSTACDTESKESGAGGLHTVPEEAVLANMESEKTL